VIRPVLACSVLFNLRLCASLRKQRIQAEHKAAQQRLQQAAVSAKNARKQQQAQQDADGPAPTPEELHRRNMRAGRFGSGAVDQSAPVRRHAPVYAVGSC